MEATWGPTSPREVAKEVMEADFNSSDNTFWDPFGVHFGTFLVSFLYLSFSMILSIFWGRFGGPAQLQKLAFG